MALQKDLYCHGVALQGRLCGDGVSLQVRLHGNNMALLMFQQRKTWNLYLQYLLLRFASRNATQDLNFISYFQSVSSKHVKYTMLCNLNRIIFGTVLKEETRNYSPPYIHLNFVHFTAVMYQLTAIISNPLTLQPQCRRMKACHTNEIPLHQVLAASVLACCTYSVL